MAQGGIRKSQYEGVMVCEAPEDEMFGFGRHEISPGARGERWFARRNCFKEKQMAKCKSGQRREATGDNREY